MKKAKIPLLIGVLGIMLVNCTETVVRPVRIDTRDGSYQVIEGVEKRLKKNVTLKDYEKIKRYYDDYTYNLHLYLTQNTMHSRIGFSIDKSVYKDDNIKERKK